MRFAGPKARVGATEVASGITHAVGALQFMNWLVNRGTAFGTAILAEDRAISKAPATLPENKSRKAKFYELSLNQTRTFHDRPDKRLVVRYRMDWFQRELIAHEYSARNKFEKNVSMIETPLPSIQVY
ncbi:hypothetical protein GQ53DRAFT_804820 [Thozetella sp. PMI_491]|nr:hypothetical protein GQ53DRAFT_804820 [Thozetella sp. PMI_491]